MVQVSDKNPVVTDGYKKVVTDSNQRFEMKTNRKVFKSAVACQATCPWSKSLYS